MSHDLAIGWTLRWFAFICWVVFVVFRFLLSWIVLKLYNVCTFSWNELLHVFFRVDYRDDTIAKHAHWVDNTDSYKCSNCEYETSNPAELSGSGHKCPRCLSFMDW